MRRTRGTEYLPTIELLRKLGEKTGFAQKDIKVVLEALDEAVTEIIKDGKAVKPFYSIAIEPVDVEERKNPFKPDTPVPAHRKARVKFMPSFKEAIK